MNQITPPFLLLTCPQNYMCSQTTECARLVLNLHAGNAATCRVYPERQNELLLGENLEMIRLKALVLVSPERSNWDGSFLLEPHALRWRKKRKLIVTFLAMLKKKSVGLGCTPMAMEALPFSFPPKKAKTV